MTRRGRAWAAGAVALAGLVAEGWEVAPTIEPISYTQAASTKSMAPGSPAQLSVVAPMGADSAGSVVSTAMPGPAGRVWDLCGIGRLAVPPGTSASAAAEMQLPAHLGAIPAEALISRTLAALRQGTARQRAAAWMLDVGPDRPPSPPELTELALSTRDPVVIAWAWGRCQQHTPCRAALARAWTEVEPGNAAGWLALHEEPRHEAEARAGLAAARHFTLRWGSLVYEAMAAVPPDAPPYLRPKLDELALGADAAVAMPSLTPAIRLCNPAPAAGSERLSACSAMAEMLTQHSDTLLGYAIGARMAENAGWPASRLAEVRAQRKRLGDAGGELPFDPEQPMSCPSVEGLGRFVEERGRLGELGYLKKRAALMQRR